MLVKWPFLDLSAVYPYITIDVMTEDWVGVLSWLDVTPSVVAVVGGVTGGGCYI